MLLAVLDLVLFVQGLRDGTEVQIKRDRLDSVNWIQGPPIKLYTTLQPKSKHTKQTHNVR